MHEVKEKSKKEGKKPAQSSAPKRNLCKSVTFFFRETHILALKLKIILSQMMVFLDIFVDFWIEMSILLSAFLTLLNKRAELHGFRLG